MQQSFWAIWSDLNARRRIVVIGATVLVFAAVLFLARGAGQRDLSLLFGGLDPAAASAVVTSLDQRGVVYEIRGESIYVETAQRDALRMSLAGEGLPQTGTQGYELLDTLTGFGTTSQMFDAAYWRAREGELARTIQSANHIRSARVHISTPSSRPFDRDQAPTASVTVATTTGQLTQPQIKALQYLVGSAVSGLAPSDVAIIDEAGGLLSDADSTAALAGDERAETLRRRAERLLAARVGAGNAVVEVSIDTVTESEQILERTLDPESRIAISTDVTESEASSQDSGGGDVTVASNLPDGDAAGGEASSNNANSETRALTNYEVSQTERQVVREPGAVRRLTVAVLVNEVQSVALDGTITSTPRSAEELASLEELVGSAVGIDPARGDVLTLHSLPFEAATADGTAATAAGPISGPVSLMSLIQLAVAALVALILGLFVLRPILTGAGRAPALPPPDEADADRMQVVSPDGRDVSDVGPALLGHSGAPPDAVARLRQMIADREAETVQILQDWIEEPDPAERN